MPKLPASLTFVPCPGGVNPLLVLQNTPRSVAGALFVLTIVPPSVAVAGPIPVAVGESTVGATGSLSVMVRVNVEGVPMLASPTPDRVKVTVSDDSETASLTMDTTNVWEVVAPGSENVRLVPSGR